MSASSGGRRSHPPAWPPFASPGTPARSQRQAWGAGREWMLDQVTPMTGEHDPGFEFRDAHPAVLRAQRNHPDVRFGASHMLYHELIPTILGQRITAGEAIKPVAPIVPTPRRARAGPRGRAAAATLARVARRKARLVVPPARRRGQACGGAAHGCEARREAVGMGAAPGCRRRREVGAAAWDRAVDDRFRHGFGDGRSRCRRGGRLPSEEPGLHRASPASHVAPTNACSSCSRRTPASAAE